MTTSSGRRARAGRSSSAAGDPQTWGVAASTLSLDSAAGIEARRIGGAREVYAKRLDPFEALHRRGGLTTGQLKAATRLFRDLCLSQGVRTDDPRASAEYLQPQGPHGASDLVNCTMIDAGKRFEAALASTGPATAEVLRALVTPAVMCGSALVWRAVVEQVTGETHGHAQAAVVRHACEDLRRAYARVDQNVRWKAPPKGPSSPR